MKDDCQITRVVIKKIITDLKLPTIILDLFNGTCTDSIVLRNLGQDYKASDRILGLAKVQQNNYLVDWYKPIFSYGGSTIYAYDIISGGYIKYSVELMNKTPECFTWAGLFVRDILSWWELEICDDDILYLGNLFGLRYVKDILDSISMMDNKEIFSSYQNTEHWINSIIGKINVVL